MADRLKGRAVIVTGAGSVPGPADREPIGNGRASAILYAAEGARVVLVDLNRDAALETQRMIEAEGGVCSVFAADVSKAHDCKAMAEHALAVYSRIDVLHNNVGIMTPHPGGIMEAHEEDWDLLMDVNVKSIFHASRAVIPPMLRQGGGSILNVSSVASLRRGMPELLIYGVSKAAVNALTRCLAAELAEKNIRVNCVMPGMIDSPAIYQELAPKTYGGDIEKMRRDRDQRIPMKRMGTPWDIARAALFLVSDDASYITGQIVAVDGGLMALAG